MNFIKVGLLIGAIVTAFMAYGQPDALAGYAVSAIVGGIALYLLLGQKGT